MEQMEQRIEHLEEQILDLERQVSELRSAPRFVEVLWVWDSNSEAMYFLNYKDVATYLTERCASDAQISSLIHTQLVFERDSRYWRVKLGDELDVVR